MWIVLGELCALFIKWLLATGRAPKTLYDKAREAQDRAYKEAGTILEGSGEDITRMAELRARACRIMLSDLRMRKKPISNFSG